MDGKFGHTVSTRRKQKKEHCISLYGKTAGEGLLCSTSYMLITLEFPETKPAAVYIKVLQVKKHAIDNVKEILLGNIAVLKKKQAAGENRTDEILYMEQFLKELEKDKIGYIRDIEVK